MLGILRRKPEDKLIEILGKDKVLTSLVERKLYSYDATPIPIERAVPMAVVFPENHHDVEKLVEVCYQEDIAIFPRGAGSGLTGGAVPTVERGVVVSFERMNRFRVDLDNAVAYAEPGVVTAQLQEYVESLGLFYPPDPSSFKYSTIGGNIAENAGGPRCLKYGVTREYVLGLTAVIKEGKTVKTGGPVIKDVAGYDITRLLVGSEGTLGLITEAVLKLIPKPRARLTALAIFHNLEDVGHAVTKIFTSGVFPSALEFMDKNAIRAVEEFKPVGLPKDAEAVLLIEVDGTPQSVQEDIKLVKELLEGMKVKVETASTEEEAQKLWTARKNLGPALGNLKTGKINEDIVVPRSTLHQVIPKVREIAQKYQLMVAVFGHIGDGNLHVNFLYDKANREEEERAEQAVDEVFEMTLAFGGSITGEHGVGLTKRKFLKWQMGDVGYELLKSIKSVFDPKNLFNPGKMLEV
ncbi:D-lactate dehydrogenase (cytochrome) [Thermocrinis albus DSM 14484]|uniref:D-lactate dehydrogenase (Cytochrome) n=1 Tax=Thermocrinis albus (strain DSM 14484 / JCM 11386 / HI 11/12) TaxID=638303 RepID=D3SNV9_THEAH|nr:FAD-linked oxidase C-terminal domain-containing protein [Thermocrinis albus]ADC88846.1 D-lactate dehydrogenase (cytochrome) [Thermocrinis albus DSM 14484]